MKKQTKSDTTKKVRVGNKNNMSALKPGGEVATRRVDSIKKANPQLGRVIGKPGVGSGGMATYGAAASDAIKAGLSKKKK